MAIQMASPLRLVTLGLAALGLTAVFLGVTLRNPRLDELPEAIALFSTAASNYVNLLFKLATVDHYQLPLK